MRRFFNIWVLATVALYYVGPIDWPGSHEPWVALFVILNVISFNIGYLALSNPKRRRYSDFDVLGLVRSRNIAIAIAIMLMYCAASILFMQLTTGQTLGTILSEGVQLDTIYTDYTTFLSERGDFNLKTQLLLLFKAGLFPIALVLLAANFQRSRIIVAVFFFPMIAFSLARGTDKETVDLFLIFALMSLYYGKRYGKRLGKRLGFRVFVLSAIPILATLFVLRRFGRFAGNLPGCLPDSPACFNFESPLAQVSPLLEVAYIFATQYITQGYEGLSIAFSLDFHFNFGLGHLPPVQRAICSGLSLGCDLVNYNETLYHAGWDTSYRWSSVYTYLANDLTWFFVPLYLFFIGWSLRLAEAEWLRRGNPSALAVIVLIGIFTLYSPANMQIGISMDWAFATIFLLYGKALTVRTRAKDPQSSTCA